MTFLLPKPKVLIIQQIRFQRFIEILKASMTSYNTIIPISIIAGLIDQNILGEQIFLRIDLCKGTDPFNLNFIIKRAKIKDLKALSKDGDITINVSDDKVTFESCVRSVSLQHVSDPSIIKCPNFTKKMQVGVPVEIKPASRLRTYLNKKGPFHFYMYNQQLEAIKAGSQDPYILTPGNRNLVCGKPDQVFSTKFFPALLDGRKARITLYAYENSIFAVSSKSDRYDFPVSIVTRIGSI